MDLMARRSMTNQSCRTRVQKMIQRNQLDWIQRKYHRPHLCLVSRSQLCAQPMANHPRVSFSTFKLVLKSQLVSAHFSPSPSFLISYHHPHPHLSCKMIDLLILQVQLVVAQQQAFQQEEHNRQQHQAQQELVHRMEQ